LIPFITAGCIIGAIGGWCFERRLRGKVSFDRALTTAILLGFAVFVSSEVIAVVFFGRPFLSFF
jgi:hypothetical protein